ncbi:Dbl homology domain-containing protein [Circinella umbellata]|nr:Dbl homology domain-containing protein [Circinella umbellata]
MPPFVQPSFELIEAKSWATECVDELISEIDDITFEPESPAVIATMNKLLQQQQQKNASSQRRKKRPNNPIRRSFSLLETNLFHNNNNHSSSFASRCQQQIYDPNFSSKQENDNNNNNKAARTWSSASLYYRNLQNQQRQRQYRQGAEDEANCSNNWTHPSSCSSKKEREGRIVWQKTFEKYLLDVNSQVNIMPDKPLSSSLSRFVMNEVLTTEETFLDRLTIIKRTFMDPLMEAASTQPRPLVNLKDIQTIFAYIPQLIMLSTSFLRQLNEAIEKGTVGNAFCEYLDQFDIYISYAANYSKAQRYASNLRNNIVCRHYVQEKRMNRMVLADYIIEPIQRIPRYCLLLKDLKRHSSPSDPDYNSLDRALKCMTALAHAMNSIQ